MPAPYSFDLRERAISAYEKGEGTQEEVSSLFRISISTFRNWYVRLRDQGELKPKEHESRGRKTYIDELGADFIKQLVKERPDILISEIQAIYKKEFQVKLSQSMVSRAFKALGLRRKKKSHYALEQEREDVKKRKRWAEEVVPLDASNLIFIDESGANLSMSSHYGRAEGSARVKMPVPFNRGNTFSMIGAISTQQVEAAVYGEWATDGAIFLGFIEKMLVPQLRPSHIVIMDNVKFHLQKSVAEAIEATGAKVLFLPAYSPDLSPIEPMWSKIKTILRKLAPRTLKEFKKAIRFAFKQINKSDLINWFKHCGYFTKLDRIPL